MSGKDLWVNLNDECVLPISYIENCIVFLERLNASIILRTIGMQNDITLAYDSKEDAILALRGISKMFNEMGIVSNIEYSEEE